MSKNYKTKKVLIADDLGFMRNTLIKVLEDLGFTKGYITQADNARDALGFLNESAQGNLVKFDIVFSDWNMPNMSGLQLLKKVRESQKYFKDIPFILITTDSEKEKVIEAVQYRVSNYIIKPATKEAVSKSLDSINF